MKTIGIRELKVNLSRYMKYVKAGERLIVTDRKKEVAVIIPLINNSQEEKVYDMTRTGKARWAGGKPQGMPKRIVMRGKAVSEAVVEDRR